MSEPALTDEQREALFGALPDGQLLVSELQGVHAIVARLIAEARAEGWDEGHDGLTSDRWERNPYRAKP